MEKRQSDEQLSEQEKIFGKRVLFESLTRRFLQNVWFGRFVSERKTRKWQILRPKQKEIFREMISIKIF